jgi:hypothetical protein
MVELSSEPENQNIAGLTTYSLQAYGWTPGGDLIGALRYEFRYLISDPKANTLMEVIIQPASLKNKVSNIVLLPGVVTFQAYIINPGRVRFMPNDAPYGALFEFAPIVVMKHPQSGIPSLMATYYAFAGKGMYYRALISMEAYAISVFPKLIG